MLYMLVEKFKTSDGAIAFLKKGFANVQSYMIENSMAKLDNETTNRILPEAKKRFEKNKDKVCIGPFYLGMPLCDAIAQRNSLGLGGVWFNIASEKNENPEIIENWKVSEMSFMPKASLKFLDCDDALILKQAIKQCVKKEKGKAKSWDYSDEIKFDLKTSLGSSTRINLFSPTGTTTDYNVSSEQWWRYKNSKLGVVLSWDEKDGQLVFGNL